MKVVWCWILRVKVLVFNNALSEKSTFMHHNLGTVQRTKVEPWAPFGNVWSILWPNLGDIWGTS